MSELYEIVIFTASLSQYAKPLIDKLDKYNRGYYQLYREHWTFHQGLYFVKDLSKLGRDLENWIIIDNSPSAYLFQQKNAMPISSWYQNKTDSELYKLIPILEEISKAKDVTKESLNLWKGRLNVTPRSPFIHKERYLPESPKTMKYSKSTRILFTNNSSNNVSDF